MAASADRTTKTRTGERISLPVKGGVKIFAGTQVSVGSDGYARPGRTSTTDLCVGIAERQADNTSGADGDISIDVLRKTVGYFGNSASGDAITLTERFKTVYVVDDVTVAKTNGTNTRIAAGKCVDVDSGGVWVEFS